MTGQEHKTFESLAGFQQYIHANISSWDRLVQQALRLIALNGIREPISGQSIPPEQIVVAHGNYRETIEYEGLLSRQRAVLLLVEQLINQGRLPCADQLKLYCPEAVTPFARRVAQIFPHYLGSEYLPQDDHPLRATIPHQDLCALTLTDGCMDLVIASAKK